MSRQSRFVTGSSVLMDDPFVDSLIDQRHGREQEFRARLLIVRRDRRTQFLDRRTELAAVAAVDLVPFRVLTDPLFC